MITIQPYRLDLSRGREVVGIAIPDGWKPVDFWISPEHPDFGILLAQVDTEAEECREEFIVVEPGDDLEAAAGEIEIAYIGSVHSQRGLLVLYLTIEPETVMDHHFNGRPDTL